MLDLRDQGQVAEIKRSDHGDGAQPAQQRASGGVPGRVGQG